MSVWMSLIEFSLTTTIRGIRQATRPCILHERVPAADRRTACAGSARASISSMRSWVIGWWRVTIVGIFCSMLEDAVAEALVVVDEVELAEPAASGRGGRGR